jgi:long-chain acyl-CoA synthetase
VRSDRTTPQATEAAPGPVWTPDHTTLVELFDRTVAAHPARPAIDFLDRVTSYRDLGDQVERAARGFARLGVTRGVKVGLCLPNTTHYAVAFFAVLKAGGTVVNFNPLYVERELVAQIQDSAIRVLVTLDAAEFYPRVAAAAAATELPYLVVCSLADALPTLKGWALRLLKRKELARWRRDARHVAFADVLKADRTVPLQAPAPSDIAVIQYTGGTTGVPKGAMLSHRAMAANADQCFVLCGMPPEPQQTMLGVLPLFHVFAMTTILLLGVRLGARIVLQPRFVLADVIRAIKTKHPTILPAVPSIFAAIVTRRPKPEDMASLTFCVSGGAPLPMSVKRDFERLTGCTLIEGYGLTEASPVVAANPPYGVLKAGSIGLPLVGTRIEMRDPETGLDVPLGERGELCVGGPQLMAGYLNRPEDTDAVFTADGLLRTGDVAWKDADGYSYIVDRIKDLILCGGYNVYPRVLEDALYAHPAVAEAIAIGVPDKYRGEVPKAFVTLRDGASATSDELMRHLEEHISRIEMPRAVEIRQSLPKTIIGKPSRKALVEEEAAKRRG